MSQIAKPEWGQYSHSKRHYGDHGDQLYSVTFGAGTNAYQDGPAQTITIQRADQTEAQFEEAAKLCLAGLNAKRAPIIDAQVEAALTFWYPDEWPDNLGLPGGSDADESFKANARKEMRAALEAARMIVEDKTIEDERDFLAASLKATVEERDAALAKEESK